MLTQAVYKCTMDNESVTTREVPGSIDPQIQHERKVSLVKLALIVPLLLVFCFWKLLYNAC